MAEWVYRPVIGVAVGVLRGWDVSVTVTGTHHLPRSGGGVIAINHIGYLDFVLAGYAARPQHRLVRFMAKQEVFGHPVAGPLMRGMHHIPVDRMSGGASFSAAVRALRAGELVGVFPEATISRSFMLKEFKRGAARMAADAGVPLIPMTLWGTQRLMTKGRKPLRERHVPVLIDVGEPLTVAPGADTLAVTAELEARMGVQLAALQAAYPDAPATEADRWWLPAALGGTAPLPAQARELDAADAAARVARRREAAATQKGKTRRQPGS